MRVTLASRDHSKTKPLKGFSTNGAFQRLSYLRFFR